MSQNAPCIREFRLLVVAPPEGSPSLDVAQLAACLKGAKLVGAAADCNDGLRLALTTYPDIIVLPWSAEAPKLLRVLDHLRDSRLSPRIVVVTNRSEPPEGFASSEEVILVEVNPLHPEKLTDSLRAALADTVSGFGRAANDKLLDKR